MYSAEFTSSIKNVSESTKEHPRKTSEFKNLAGQTVKSSGNHPGEWLFDGEPESGRRVGVSTEISK
jgi:hypothetical protein